MRTIRLHNLTQTIMKLKTYENENPRMWNPRFDAMTVSANRKQGYFAFNSKSIRDLGLAPGKRVLIARDEDSRNDWYVRIADETDETAAKLSYGGAKSLRQIYSLRAYNRAASGAICDSVKATYSVSFILAANPTKMPDGTVWHRILTANPIRTR